MSVIDTYIAEAPQAHQAKLMQIRTLISNNAKDASEVIRWGMPTFYLHGNLVHFALHKSHIGFYPGESGVKHFVNQLQGYRYSKGAIQFPLNKELPETLIQEIVIFRVKENTC